MIKFLKDNWILTLALLALPANYLLGSNISGELPIILMCVALTCMYITGKYSKTFKGQIVARVTAIVAAFSLLGIVITDMLYITCNEIDVFVVAIDVSLTLALIFLLVYNNMLKSRRKKVNGRK